MPKYTVCLALIVLSACAVTNPRDEYQALLSSQGNKAATTFAAAIQRTTPTLLPKGGKISFEFAADSPIIILDGVSSFYKLFEVRGTPEEKVDIATFSPVKVGPAGGLGPVYLVKPRLFVLDEAGTAQVETPAQGKVGAAGFGPLQYEASWQVTMPTSGKVYLLVTSDNRVLDQPVSSYQVDAYTGGKVSVPYSMSLPLRAHSTGVLSIVRQ